MAGSPTPRVRGPAPTDGKSGAHACLWRNRRGAAALIAAIAAPVLLISVAMGVEVSHWATRKLDYQRSADTAALAGGVALARNDNPEQAANAAADVAELSGIAGGARSWSWASLVLTDNLITVTITNGVHNSADPAVLVSVQGSVPLLFSRLITTATQITLGASAMAELGPQPCILTLGGSGKGISAAGNVTMAMPGCAMYSDSNISMTGTVTINAAALYAASGITISSNVSGTGTNPAVQYAGVAPLSDPYASDSAVQNALAKASCAPTQLPAISGNTVTLNPNTCYGSISISGNQTLVFNGAGLYTINGSLNATGNSSQNTTIDGAGITIVSTGALSITGNFNNGAVTLTAPTIATAQNGAIPGILFASDTSVGSSVAGNAPIPFTGLIYTPNAALSFSGTPTSTSGGCDKVIAQSVSMVGNAVLASACSSYNLNSFGILPNNSLVQLVE